MRHDREPGRKLPEDEIERIAIEYRYKGGGRWDQWINALTDFESLDNYDIVTDRMQVRLDSGIANLSHRQLTSVQYDRGPRRLAVVVHESVYEGLALDRPAGALAFYLEVANVILSCDEIGDLIPEMREDALATIGERPQHRQSPVLAAAIMIPVPAMVVVGRDGRPITASRLAKLLGVPESVAAKRLARHRRWSDAAIEKLMAERSPIRIETDFEARVFRQGVQALEDAVRRGRISGIGDAPNGVKKE